jgi:DNA-binding response OmpR family regulator
MKEENKYRILVIEYEEVLASAIRDILELENYLALATTDAYAAGLVIDSFCPDIVMLGYYSYIEKSFLLERCQYNYPIVYICSQTVVARIRHNYFFSSQDRILEKPFDAEEMLVNLDSMRPLCKTS